LGESQVRDSSLPYSSTLAAARYSRLRHSGLDLQLCSELTSRLFLVRIYVFRGSFYGCQVPIEPRLKSLSIEGDNTSIFICDVNSFNCWHFTPIVVNLFYQLLLLASEVGMPAVVGLASKLKLFSLVTLLPWPLTFRSLNGVTGHPCHGLPFCQFSACYTLPFSTYGQARYRQTADDGRQRLMPPSYGGGA